MELSSIQKPLKVIWLMVNDMFGFNLSDIKWFKLD